MVTIFKLDIEGVHSFPPMTVIKDLSVSLKSFQVEEVEIEDITRKMRRILVVSGIPPKSGMRKETIRVRFRVEMDLDSLKARFPNGKLIGQIELDSDLPLFVYREEKV